jgi:hypothetical protein
MSTAVYKINKRFDYTDAGRLERYLYRKGYTATVESGWPNYGEIRITSNAPSGVLNSAVDAATMNYCGECRRRLKALDDHML